MPIRPKCISSTTRENIIRSRGRSTYRGHRKATRSSSKPAHQDQARISRPAPQMWCSAQQSIEEAQAFYKSLKDRVVGFGRKADDVAVMPGFLPVIGRTPKEAADKLAELDQWTDLKSAMPLLEERIGHSLTAYDPDAPLPDLPISDQLRSRAELLTALARRENLTIRQLALRVAAGRGHHIVLGTPVEIADRMQQWFDGRAADGFNVMPAFFPEGLEDFTQLVVPILQERGLFRTDYSGSTLRDHLGLNRPTLVAPHPMQI